MEPGHLRLFNHVAAASGVHVIREHFLGSRLTGRIADPPLSIILRSPHARTSEIGNAIMAGQEADHHVTDFRWR
jgi:hypothetical protein